MSFFVSSIAISLVIDDKIGEKNIAEIEDYHSHNTERLNVEEVKNLISKLALVRKELFSEDVDDFIV